MPRCLSCGREIVETKHHGETYAIDGYCLHTGKTKRVSAKNDNGTAIEFLQMSEPKDYFLCINCFAKTGTRDVWMSTFPDAGDITTLCR
ncbi:MAG: hypothetical protein P9L99_10395 [Candidatus Lernaella stagnicola]|nr:hypothetical protein [Candidatus Lernaella stagnicola]